MGIKCTNPQQQTQPQPQNLQIIHQPTHKTPKNTKSTQHNNHHNNKIKNLRQMLCCLTFYHVQSNPEQNQIELGQGNENKQDSKIIKPIEFTQKSQCSGNFNKIHNLCCGNNIAQQIDYQVNSAHRFCTNTQQQQFNYFPHQNQQSNKNSAYFSFTPTKYPQHQQSNKNKNKFNTQQKLTQQILTQQRLTQQKSQQQKIKNNKNIQIIFRAKNIGTISQYCNSNIINLNKIQIPFQVIKLSLHTNIIKNLNKYYPEFIEKYNNKTEVRSSLWRMLQNGTYINLLQNLHGIFITKDQFYQGFYIKNSEISYIPDLNGIYIDKIYVYKGNLKQGQPSGKGKLINCNTQQIYDGNWYEGSFFQGNIQRDKYIYKGQFYQNLASGIGQLFINNKNIRYKGKFLQGYFNDQDAEYQCDQYSYTGGFINGRKNGYGILYDKIKDIKCIGNWVQDRLLKIFDKVGQQPNSFVTNN